jgi:hypothetical protein
MELHDRISRSKDVPPDTGVSNVNRKHLHNLDELPHMPEKNPLCGSLVKLMLRN